MAWIYYLDDSKKIKQRKILDFISHLELVILWIKPEKYSFTQDEINLVLKSLNNFHCVLWFISCENEFASRKLNDVKRVFGKWRGLSKNIFRRNEYFLEQKKYYSDLSTLSYSEVIEGEDFF